MALPTHPYSTVEEYLWQEQRAEVKHDYYNGQVYAMAGGSPNHSRIAVNLTGELRSLLRGRACQVFNSDLKVAVSGNRGKAKAKKHQPEDEFVSYPDASVVCGKLEFYKGDGLTIANPTVLFEVLSPSTRNYDRSIKLEQYRKLSSLMAYVILDSEQVWVEQYFRTSQNSWQVNTALEEREAVLYIAALNITMPLSQLYEDISFDSDDEGEDNPEAE